MRYQLLLILSILFLAQNVEAQNKTNSDSTSKKKQSDDESFNPSLGDLMNVPIVSVSREKENVFDAPLSAFVVTRADIEKSGSTSIPEALRLVPGVFVTEMANGTYQVDIRGLNNTPAFSDGLINKTILVMIDNRPVFNQFQGGTYWENLPVEINDVDRIEVIQGPSAALYGPNAVNGVINIITRKLDKTGLMVYSNSQYDFKTNSYLANLSTGYKINEKLSFILSGNYADRKRQVVDFYNTDMAGQSSFADYDKTIVDSRFSKQDIYPDPNRSVNKKAVNFFATYAPTDKIKFDLSAGYQDSDPLRMLAVGYVGTASYYAPSHSRYFMGKGEIYGFSFQISNNKGVQSLVKGSPSYQYDFSTTDFYIDYNFKYKKIFSLKPAISYQFASISDLPYINQTFYGGVFNNKATMYNYAGSLKFELTPIEQIRFVAAARVDRFRYPENKTFLSYEFALNIKPNDNHNIRLIASRAYQGSYMFPVLVDFSSKSPFGTQKFAPNLDLNPAHIDLLELGYRVKIFSNLSIDLSIFNQKGSGYSEALSSVSFGKDGLTLTLKNQNIDLKAVQNGITIAVNSTFLNNKIHFKPFITYSKTKINNYSPYNNQPSPGDGTFNYNTYHDFTSNYTPTTFGGFVLNVIPTSKININLSMYSYNNYSLYTFREVPPTPGPQNPNPVYAPYVTTPATNLNGNVLWNAKISYKVQQHLKVYINGRNALNNTNRQFYAGDQIGAMYLAGFTLDY